MTGKKFGKLTVLERAGSKNDKAAWLCECECGNQTVVSGGHLRSGEIVSCGCHRASEASKRASSRIKHGDTLNHSSTRLYTIWRGMKVRCTLPTEKAFPHYGGRGITICDEWLDYQTFKEWAMSHGYDDSKTIDRIDVNQGYCPENCRWATYKQQANNKRNTVYIEFDGQRHSISEWADIFKITYDTLRSRLRSDLTMPLIARQVGYKQTCTVT